MDTSEYEGTPRSQSKHTLTNRACGENYSTEKLSAQCYPEWANQSVKRDKRMQRARAVSDQSSPRASLFAKSLAEESTATV